ncbi:unnamed protein product [Soboliphyme baturini]|uniref:Thioredoxin domain-containing protein n=1 Tax=Soboliphyme baturini TaxID=241478 RepID=A0A183J596_9BILA|nr:unnamed protein product [Soboliphyme baturini]
MSVLGNVKLYIKSEPVPQFDAGPVKTVVGSTFRKIVLDETKDVLIELYAPWCGHCKALEPVYKELATQLRSDANLVIAKMNAIDNDSPVEYSVNGFPTIYFAPSGKKEKPISYSGERKVEDFINFLKQNAVVSFKKSEL